MFWLSQKQKKERQNYAKTSKNNKKQNSKSNYDNGHQYKYIMWK